jgi:hypothetical protein
VAGAPAFGVEAPDGDGETPEPYIMRIGLYAL